MEHDELKKKLDAFLDEELPSSENSQVARHLESCAECRGYTEDWRSTSTALFQSRSEPIDEAFVRRVMRALPPQRELELKRPFLWAWLMPVCAASAVFILAAVLGNPSPLISSESLLLAELPEASPSSRLLDNHDIRPEEIFALATEEP